MVSSFINSLLFTTAFISASLSIWISQLVCIPIKLVSPTLFHNSISYHKRKFAVLLIAVNQYFTRTRVQLILPNSLRVETLRDGTPQINWQKRAVVIANHQLYNDWIYAWWLSYTANIHEAPLIMLKESIKKIPVFGWCGTIWEFLYMARKWDIDQERIKQSMNKIRNAPPGDANWLFLFPEGTVTSPDTVKRSRKFAEKLGIKHPKNTLVPRTRGLEACLHGLNGSVETLYDLSIYYDGVPAGDYGERFYTLGNMYFKGKYPKTVKIHVREFKIKDIPLESPQKFEQWLYKTWHEKDQIMEDLRGNVEYTAEFPLKLRSWNEFFSIYLLPLAFISVYLASR